MIKMKHKPMMAEVGKIKIGMKGEEKKSQGGKKYRQPVKLDHFIVTTTDKGPDGNFTHDTAVMEKLGASPTEIPIRLPFDDIDMNFFTQYQYYVGKKCICRGDGEKATRTNKKEEVSEVICNTGTCEYMKSGKCKVSGVLSAMIPYSLDMCGIYRFRTHGWNSVSGILAALTFFKENTNGVLQGLPLKLKFLKKHTEEHGSVPVVSIVLDAIEMLELRQLAIAESQNRTALGVDIKQIEMTAVQGGFMAQTDTDADIAEEHYEENMDDEKGTGADDLAENLRGRASEQETQEAEIIEPDGDQSEQQQNLDIRENETPI